MSAPRARGVSRRDPAHRRTQLNAKLHPLVGAMLFGAALPKSADLTSFCPPVFDQGASGSCTAHSLSGGLVTSTGAQKQPLGFVPSPCGIYACERSLERAQVRAAGPLPPLEDSGAMLADGISAVQGFGVMPYQGPTPDGRISDVWTAQDTSAAPANVNAEPDLMGLEEAATKLIVGSHRIVETGPDVASVTAATIAAGFAVWLGFFADSAFESLKPGEIASLPNESDPNGGGHAVYLVGFDTRADGSLVYTLRNSWSSGWCSGGMCLVGEQWLEAVWDAYVLDVSIAQEVA